MNVSQSCLHSLNKLPKPGFVVQVWGLVEVNKLHQVVRGVSNEKWYRMSARSYQIEESHFS